MSTRAKHQEIVIQDIPDVNNDTWGYIARGHVPVDVFIKAVEEKTGATLTGLEAEVYHDCWRFIPGQPGEDGGHGGRYVDAKAGQRGAFLVTVLEL